MPPEKKKGTVKTMAETVFVTREWVESFLKAQEKIAVVCHAHPDGDAVGSGIGLSVILSHWGKDVIFLSPSPIPARFSFMTGSCPFPVIAYDGQDPDVLFAGRTVVTVDTASMELAGDLGNAFSGAWRPALSIDHHRTNSPFADALLLDAEASACAEIIAGLIAEDGEITADIALPLYVGINADTGGFRFSNTTSRTHEITARLLAAGIDAAAVNIALYETRSFAEITAERLALEHLRLYAHGSVGIVTFTTDMMRENGLSDEDIDNVVNLIRSVNSVNVAVHLKPRGEGVYKVSMRSKNGVYISDVCAALGGGGHLCAAGATVTAPTPQAAEKIVLDQIAETLGLTL